ncbi:MAG: helicase-related protein [Pseudomonadota bacterium]
MNAGGWGYVLFHGGVPGDKRGGLVDRFRDDPDCRVFLSTDAGGVGLNLQHAASTVINMDMPWNPAVLEQRIGRVHRLGQKRSVQVVNFVSQGSIEEGMLSLLAFKKSLFAGVLDGGDTQVLLHGTRLSRFMQSVEQVAGTVAATEPMTAAIETIDAAPRAELPQAVGTAVAPMPADMAVAAGAGDPWAGLIDTGLKLMETLAGTSSREGGERAAATAPWIETDAATGQSYLKLPVPKPETVHRLAAALTGLLAELRR